MDAFTRLQTNVDDMTPFRSRGIDIGGLANYASRSLVCPGMTVTGADTQGTRLDIEDTFAYMRQIELGADQLVVVPGGDLTRGLLRYADELQQVQRSVAQGRPLSLFTPRLSFLVRQMLGLRFRDTAAIEPNLAELFDHKLSARLLPGAAGHFTAWRSMFRNLGDFDRLRQQVLAEAAEVLETDSVMLKDPGADGGASNLLVGPGTDPAEVAQFLAEHGHKQLVIEAAYPADMFDMTEISAQVAVGLGGWKLLKLTQQITEGNAHKGNIVSVGQFLVDVQVYQAIMRAIIPFCNEAVRRGVGRGGQPDQEMVRTIGIDLLVIRFAGMVFVYVIEINGRGTAAKYVCSFADQVAPRFGGSCSVVMENTEIPKGMGHEDLIHHRVDGMLYDGTDRPGIVPGNPGCWRGSGKATLFFVGANRDQAEGVRHRYHDRLHRIETRRSRVFLPL